MSPTSQVQPDIPAEEVQSSATKTPVPSGTSRRPRSAVTSVKKKPTIKCPQCGKQLVGSHVDLLRHIAAIHDEKKYVCPEKGCEKKYGRSSHLARHIRISHRGAKSSKPAVITISDYESEPESEEPPVTKAATCISDGTSNAPLRDEGPGDISRELIFKNIREAAAKSKAAQAAAAAKKKSSTEAILPADERPRDFYEPMTVDSWVINEPPPAAKKRTFTEAILVDDEASNDSFESEHSSPVIPAAPPAAKKRKVNEILDSFYTRLSPSPEVTVTTKSNTPDEHPQGLEQLFGQAKLDLQREKKLRQSAEDRLKTKDGLEERMQELERKLQQELSRKTAAEDEIKTWKHAWKKEFARKQALEDELKVERELKYGLELEVKKLACDLEKESSGEITKSNDQKVKNLQWALEDALKGRAGFEQKVKDLKHELDEERSRRIALDDEMKDLHKWVDEAASKL